MLVFSSPLFFSFIGVGGMIKGVKAKSLYVVFRIPDYTTKLLDMPWGEMFTYSGSSFSSTKREG